MKDVLLLSIVAKPDYISAVRMFISAVAARMNFSLAQIEDIRTAVSESCTMAMRTAPEKIDIEATIGKSLEVSVYAVNASRDVDEEENEFSIMLIDAMTDEMSITKDEKCKGIDIVFNVE